MTKTYEIKNNELIIDDPRLCGAQWKYTFPLMNGKFSYNIGRRRDNMYEEDKHGVVVMLCFTIFLMFLGVCFDEKLFSLGLLFGGVAFLVVILEILVDLWTGDVLHLRRKYEEYIYSVCYDEKDYLSLKSDLDNYFQEK